MNLFVDTSVWSLVLRRDTVPSRPEVVLLSRCLAEGEAIFTTGLVLQELLQGFAGPRQRRAIEQRFSSLPLVVPTLKDHIEAADIRNKCRQKGLQIGTIDALLAQLCIRHELSLLTTDGDFAQIARSFPLRLLKAGEK